MSKRLYAQLRPDDVSLAHLIDLQQQTPGRGKMVHRDKLHLTLIHFGIVENILAVLPAGDIQKLEALAHYVDATTSILESYNDTVFELQPIKVDRFGEQGRTIVVTYHPNAEIISLHQKLLDVLIRFFVECGVSDTDSFMANDPNFVHARSIRPHITIAKYYDGKLPLLNLESVRLTVMPFVYEQ